MKFSEVFALKHHFCGFFWQNEDVFGAIGCHPLEVMSYEGDTEAIIANKALHPKIVAIGELGLDYSSKYCFFGFILLIMQIFAFIFLNF